ncbi:CHAD domain-containing protein [Streptomyces sp. NPDC059378]|uniref:CHAD domain-containing protein n=1 Tax=Streptomyces sp. NPDC059378 TaxID=3346815 RepID=UPI003684F551
MTLSKQETEREHEAPPVADELLGYLDEQVNTLVDVEPAVRRGPPDSVHQMRVTCRRLRSTLRSYRSVPARERTDPIREELKWLGGEPGAERDQEVLVERLGAHIDASPPRAGPRTRRRPAARVARRPRLGGPPAQPRRPPLTPLPGPAPGPQGGREDPVRHRTGTRLARRARPAARQTRQGRATAARRAPGQRRREALRNLALAAHAAGESAFTWGLLYGQEQAAAERCEQRLPAAWAEASKPGPRNALAR